MVGVDGSNWMELFTTCDCGKRMTVEPRQAGGEAACDRARIVAVAMLSELRRLAGLSPFISGTVAEIRRLRADGDLSASAGCLVCGATNSDAVELVGH